MSAYEGFDCMDFNLEVMIIIMITIMIMVMIMIMIMIMITIGTTFVFRRPQFPTDT